MQPNQPVTDTEAKDSSSTGPNKWESSAIYRHGVTNFSKREAVSIAVTANDELVVQAIDRDNNPVGEILRTPFAKVELGGAMSNVNLFTGGKKYRMQITTEPYSLGSRSVLPADQTIDTIEQYKRANVPALIELARKSGVKITYLSPLKYWLAIAGVTLGIIAIAVVYAIAADN